MLAKKKTHLSDVVTTHAPEGANDANWCMVEHQLEQARISIETACSYLVEIEGNPENATERHNANACYHIIKSIRLALLQHRATFLSYLSDTDVPERISRKEL